MIDFWCVCTGQYYNPQHVLTLHNMIARNIPKHWVFGRDWNLNCVNDFHEKDKDHVVGLCPDKYISWRAQPKYPGWWQKIYMLKLPAINTRNIYFDLDVVVGRDLSPLFSYADCFLAMPENWAKSGHGGFQSSVICWNGYFYPDNFDLSKIGNPSGGNYGYYKQDGVSHWGDQEYLTFNYGGVIKSIDPDLVKSYRYHCRGGLPDHAIVAAFHGKPKPWECDTQWVKEIYL